MMLGKNQQQANFTKSEGSASEQLIYRFVFFWERLILSPRLRAIPCRKREKFTLIIIVLTHIY